MTKLNFLNNKKYIPYLILFILLLTIVVYSNSIRNEFTNWDDDAYVQENADIKEISAHNIKNIFTSYYQSMYLPATIISFAAEYKLFKYNPIAYHLDNLILHLINIVLVFIFILKLTKKQEIAFIVSLFFAIHPMHVESVSWISERKDVLYAVFFMLSLIYYFNHITEQRKTNLKGLNYILSVIFFILAALSKSAAVVLPAILLLTDYYTGRKLKLNLIIEKIPFFIISLIFLIIMKYSFKDTMNVDNSYFNIHNRIFIISYGIIFYIVKVFIPLKLSVYYPFEGTDYNLPLSYYLSLAGVLIIIIAVIFIKKFRKEIIFGMIFYFITVAMVIQIVPFGSVIVADRYAYIPYIGLFFIIGHVFSYYFNKINTIEFRYILLVCAGLLTIFYSYLTYERNKVWQNNESIWTDVTDKYPVKFACYQLGLAKENDKQYEQALLLFNKALLTDSLDTKVYNAIGIVKCKLKDFAGAIPYFDIALKIKPDFEAAKVNRSIAIKYLSENSPVSASKDTIISKDGILKQKQAFDNLMKTALESYGKNDYRTAITQVNKALKINDKIPEAYYYRGIFKYSMNDYDGALEDYNKAIKLNTNFAEAYNNLAYTECSMAMKTKSSSSEKLFKEGIEDCDIAIKIKPGLDEPYNTRGFIKYNIATSNLSAIEKESSMRHTQLSIYNINLLKESINDFNKAIELNSKNYDAIFNRGIAKYRSDDKAGGCEDWRRAASGGGDKTTKDATEMIRKYCK